MDYEIEQSEIIESVDTFAKKYCATLWAGKRWNKFKGDFVPRIVASYLNGHLSKNYKIVGPNVYIEGNPTEFDLMIVDSQAIQVPLTSAFPRENIIRIIEIKTSGVFNIEKDVGKVRNDFESVLICLKTSKTYRDKIIALPKFKAAYLSISERINPIHENSIKFGDQTRKILKPYPAFFLYDSARKEIQKGEWRKFVKYIVDGI